MTKAPENPSPAQREAARQANYARIADSIAAQRTRPSAFRRRPADKRRPAQEALHFR